MNKSQSVQALRKANPRARAGFAQSVDIAANTVRAQIASDGANVDGDALTGSYPRRRLVALSAAAGTALAAATTVAVLLMVASPGGGPGVDSAAAAVKRAAALTAASAEDSGTAVVRIVHNDELWAGTTIRWNGGDLVVASDAPRRARRPGSELRLVDGTMYGPGDDGGWVVLGSPKSIDADSGTTPDEYLAAVRDDVGGATLRRITGAMTGLTTSGLDDGSIVYRGTVAAGLIAREQGFKEGEAIRVFPFGYVAHDAAADPTARLDTAVTVGADGIVREIAVTWGTSASAWKYTVSYSNLDATPAPVAPEDAKPLRER
jgi:hypothetical protein